MVKFYEQTISTYLNNEVVESYNFIILEEEPQTEEIKVTWENLEDIVYRFGCWLPFTFWNFRKGKVISFFNHLILLHYGRKLKDIKEWKQKETNIYIKISYTDYTPSLGEVIQYHDGDKAIQYLKEKELIK